MAVSNIVSADLIAAILGESVQVTRRSEIYESDGTTLWSDSAGTPRLVDGSISVDSGRDERRTIECTFDNADHVLNHDPDGFWYDKVLKFYRGVRYKNLRVQPRVLIVDDSVTDNFKASKIFQRFGYTVTTNLAPVTLNDFVGYDIIVAWTGVNTPTTATYQLLQDAYTAGYAVFTMGSKATSANVPLIATTTTKSTSTAAQLKIGNYDSPAKGGLAVGTLIPNTLTTTGDLLPTTIRSTARTGLDITWNAVTYIGGIYEVSASGGRWFHLTHQRFTLDQYQSSLWLGQVITNIVTWLYDYSEYIEYETQVGEFMIDQIKESSSTALISITGRDYTKKLLGNKFTSSGSFAAGQPLDTVVGAIAANGGVLKFIAGSGATIAAQIDYTRTDERWKVINDICTSNNVEVFFNAQGYLVTRPIRDPVTSPTALTLSADSQTGNLVSYDKTSSDTRVYNVIVVTGDNGDAVSAGNLYQAILYNTEPSSPTRVAKLGERHYFYTSAYFTSNDQCLAMAQGMLSVLALEEFALEFSSIVFPWLEAGEIVGFEDPEPGNDEPTRFLLTTFTLPLVPGPMSGSGKRVTIVGSAT